jgi:hypothetical protein
MSYIHKETQLYPVTEADIRALHPNTSFPTPFVAPDEYAVVFTGPQPTFDPVTQHVREAAPELSSKGQYEQQWVVVEKYETAEEREAAIAADIGLKLEALKSSIVQKVQQRLDDFAKTRAYDDIKSLSDYADDEDPVFRAEGIYGKSRRSLTWRTTINFMNDVKAGIRPIPSGYADVEAELPELNWPV